MNIWDRLCDIVEVWSSDQKNQQNKCSKINPEQTNVYISHFIPFCQYVLTVKIDLGGVLAGLGQIAQQASQQGNNGNNGNNNNNDPLFGLIGGILNGQNGGQNPLFPTVVTNPPQTPRPPIVTTTTTTTTTTFRPRPPQTPRPPIINNPGNGNGFNTGQYIAVHETFRNEYDSLIQFCRQHPCTVRMLVRNGSFFAFCLGD